MIPSANLRQLVADLQAAIAAGQHGMVALHLRRLMRPWGIDTPLYRDLFTVDDESAIGELWERILMREGMLLTHKGDLIRMGCSLYGLMVTAAIEQAFPRLRLVASKEMVHIARVCEDFRKKHPTPVTRLASSQ